MQQGLSPAQPAGVFSHEPEEDEYAHLKPQSFANWSASDPPALEWLVDGLIPMGTVTFLSGDGGLGKTQLGQQLVLAAALGASWCGKPVQQMPSVALFCEDKADEIGRRTVRILEALNVRRDDKRLNDAHFFCRVGENNTMMRSMWRGAHHIGYHTTRFYQELRAFAVARQARLVLIDSLHDVFSGNENFRPEARAFVQGMAKIATMINGAVVVLAHPSLSGLDRGIGTSGSTAWNNAVRSRLYLTLPDTPAIARDTEIRLLTTVKANYSRAGEKIYLKRRGGVFVAIGTDEAAHPSARVKSARPA